MSSVAYSAAPINSWRPRRTHTCRHLGGCWTAALHRAQPPRRRSHHRRIQRGVEIHHVTVYRWVRRFISLLANAARLTRHSPGDRWHVDETYVKVNGL
jgi:hypothetical protein